MPTFFGTLTGFTLPYTDILSNTLSPNSGQDYLNDYEYNPPTGNTAFSYIGIGSSKLSELKKYGGNGFTQELLYSSKTENDVTINFTGYSFTYTGKPGTTTIVKYYDRSDGYTEISGHTSGFTKTEVINKMLTRNEHFLGFVEQPTVYSDVFVERGKQGVMENNLRLGEIDNMGELNVYGNKFFTIKKQ